MSVKFVLIFLLVSSLLFTACGETTTSPNEGTINKETTSSTEGTIDGGTTVNEGIDNSNGDLNPSLDDACNDISIQELMGAAKSLNDSSDLALSLLETSRAFSALSKSLISAGSSANPIYVESMLASSQNILVMSNNIGEMSGRILVMTDNIGDMSERILQTQNIQSQNLALIQASTLTAQNNLKLILKVDNTVEDILEIPSVIPTAIPSIFPTAPPLVIPTAIPSIFPTVTLSN